ncbi:MAG: hypothetical protein PHE89_07045 [Alphaproteobacteria bacterium]|nr:hypothetical protein [Alphaproteobacteria bacterium]
MKIYQVGGAVRDKLLGIQAKDVDYVVVGSTPAEMISLGYVQVGKNFPVFINPHNKAEYALARKEKKTGNKHTDFEFVFTPDITLEEDMQRRDFTCNALAYDEESKELIDFNGGVRDIENKVLRHVNSLHFVEDPLRILRMCRFVAQLNFSVVPETMALTQKMVGEQMLQNLSVERVWREIERALNTAHFYKFIETTKACGAFSVLFPELTEKGLSLLKEAEKTCAEVKFAVLLSSLVDEEAIKSLCQRLKIPNKYKKTSLMTIHYVHSLSEFLGMTLEQQVDFVEEICGHGKFEKMRNLLDFAKIISQDSTKSQQNLAQTDELVCKFCDILSNISPFVLNSKHKSLDSSEIKEMRRLYRLEEFKKMYNLI